MHGIVYSSRKEFVVTWLLLKLDDMYVVFLSVCPKAIAISSSLLQVQATDADSGENARILFEIVPSSSSMAFSINSTTGTISTTSSLDFESQVQHRFTVRAWDNGSPTRMTGTTSVVIDVTNVDDHAPHFLLSLYQASVREHSSPGTPVVTVSAADIDPFSAITYSIVTGDQRLFTIKSSTGVITVLADIDRESQSTYNLTVAALSHSNSTLVAANRTTTTVTVTILDINDFPPVFSQPIYTYPVPENLATGSQIGSVLASDLHDSGLNAVVSDFELISGNGSSVFTISRSGVLQLNQTLDRETAALYTAVVQATDSGVPSMSATATLVFVITDINDNRPVFEQPDYNASLREDVGIGYPLITLTATDSDAGSNGDVVYSIAVTSAPFMIDQASGVVTVSGNLNYSVAPLYRLTVTASDQGTTTVMASQVILLVNVLPKPNGTPIFQNLPYTTTLLENSTLGTFVVMVQAVSGDPLIKGPVTYSLSAPLTLQWSVDKTSGAVTLQRPLDFEADRQVMLTVVAQVTDLQNLTLSSTAIVTVNVGDVNDNAPVLSPLRLVINVSEASGVPVSVGQLVTNDVDTVVSPLVFNLVSSSLPGAVLVNSAGDVRLNMKLDRESVSSIILNVSVTDGVFIAYGMVVVNVLDANDNPPMFTNPVYLASIAERSATGLFVLSVTAQDNDIDKNAQLTYSISSGNINSTFVINATTGVIRLVGPVDYESLTMYKLLVTVSDMGAIPLTANCTVLINITDIDDEPPVFVTASYQLDVVENATLATSLLSVLATDPDGGLSSSRIQYSITSGNTGDVFQLQAMSGILTLAKTLDFETQSTYRLQVFASNGGVTGPGSTALITVSVMDINDNPPAFSAALYTRRVLENAIIGHPVITMHATDADTGVGGVVSRYTIVSGNTDDVFNVTPSTGVLLVAKSLDYDTHPFGYNLVIRATDGGSPPLHGDTTVAVFLDDFNDNAPVFSSPQYSARVFESAVTGMAILNITATDADSGTNAEIVYSLRGQTPFSVDQQTGTVRLVSSLDRENISSYTITADAHDRGIPQLVGSTTLSITVLDSNDQIPRFSLPSYSGSVLEDSIAGTSVLQVVAVDDDRGSNAVIRYQLNIAGSAPFFVGAVSGDIFVNGSLDRERTPSYTFAVRATDQGQPPASSVVFVTISIDDKNDNPPVFNQTLYSVTVLENMDLRSVVYTLHATDADVGNNAVLTYSITGGNVLGRFNTEPTSSNIVLVGLLDRELVASYRLSIAVVDGGIPQMSGSTMLDITVADVNDNTPVFRQSSYSYTVAEDLSAGLEVGRLEAIDRDAGSNAVITYVLTNTSIPFSINTTAGLLTVAAPGLDYDTQTVFVFNAVAMDGGSPSLNSTVQVTVSLTDINDNSPVFEPAQYSITVPENTTAGSILITVTASDDDDTSNALLSYSIVSGNAQGHFVINALRGSVELLGQLDRETTASYELALRAQDNGTPQRNGRANLSIIVQDVNDNSPVISPTQASTVFRENGGPVTIFRTLIVSDEDTFPLYSLTARLMLDSGLAAPSSDSLRLSGTIPATLSVSGSGSHQIIISGAASVVQYQSLLQDIQFVSVADEPVSTVRQVTVSVNDGLSNSPISTVSISIVYVNDHAPQLQLGNQSINYSTSFTEEGPAVSIVSPAAVLSDADGGMNMIQSLNITIKNAANGASEMIALSVGSIPSISMQRGSTQTDQYLNLIGPASLSEFQSVLRLLTYINTADELAGVPWREVCMLASDAMFFTNLACVNVSLLHQNDAPLLRLGAFTDNVVVYNETVSSVNIADTNASITDSDDLLLTQMIVQITSYQAAADNLTASTAGTAISVQQHGDSLVFTGADTPANYLMALRSVRFSYTLQTGETFESLEQSGTIRRLRVFCSEGKLNSSVATSIITFSATNNAPMVRIAGMKIYAVSFSEDNGPLPVTGNSLRVFDADSVSLVSARITFSSPPVDAGERLSIATVPAGIRTQYFSSSGTLTLSGTANLVAYQQALNSIEYVNPGDNPTSATRRLFLTVSDGQLSSDLTVMEIAVAPVNDRPVVSPSVLPPVVFTENGPAVNIASAANITDPDSSILEIIVTIVNARDSSQETIEGSASITRRLVIPPASFAFYFADSLGNPVARSPSEMTDVLRSLQYKNSAPEPDASAQRQVLITVSDGKAFSQNTSASIAITLVNDNAPVVSPAQQTVPLMENAPVGHRVLQVSATDADVDSVLVYSLVDNFTLFAINSSTGLVSTSGLLDYDVPPHQYSLQISVFDGQFTATAMANITLLDVNDNSPSFMDASVKVNVLESRDTGSVVLTALATDADSGINGIVQYMLEPDFGANLFQLNLTSGQLSIGSKLDYETDANYTLRVKAYDLGLPSMSSVLTVFVRVIDVNDNPPIFDPTEVAISLSESAPVRSTVVEMNASDVDSNAILYSIGSSVFSIDAQSGVVSIAQPLDYEQTAMYNITVTAVDANRLPVLSSTARLIVSILDVNDIPPQFSHVVYNASISESIALHSAVINVTASDQDSGLNGLLQYSIIGGNIGNSFSIDQAGQVSVIGQLDFETRSFYRLEIRAQDYGIPPLNSSTLLEITILDFNDERPVFPASTVQANVSEGVAVLPHPVTQLLASDGDQGSNALVRYSILTGNNGSVFSINSRTGWLEVVSMLDRERTSQYLLVIEARDLGAPPLFSTVNVVISILDVNDNAPQFSTGFFPTRIEENEPAGTPVASLAATDQDVGSNAQIVYSLTGGLGQFAVNESTGEVSTLTPLDYDGRPHQYNLTVTAQDEGMPSLSSSTTLLVDIIDLNDNSPRLAVSQLQVSVPENTVAASIAQLNASDADSGINAQLVYRITSGNVGSKFAVSASGLVSLNASLDRETLAKYTLTVS